MRAVPLTRSADKPYVEATAENAVNGSYPLARFLYVYVNKAPGADLDASLREIIAAHGLTGDPSSGRDIPDIEDPWLMGLLAWADEVRDLDCEFVDTLFLDVLRCAHADAEDGQVAATAT